MSSLPFSCVLDASVAAKTCIEEPLTAQAEAFLDRLAAPETQMYVPDIFYAECANVLWKYVRLRGYATAQAEQDLADLLALPLIRVPLPEIVQDALRIAVQHNIAAYDACYLALAGKQRVPLVTADEALVRKMQGTAYETVSLTDLALP